MLVEANLGPARRKPRGYLFARASNETGHLVNQAARTTTVLRGLMTRLFVVADDLSAAWVTEW